MKGSTLDIVQGLFDKLQQVPDRVSAFERRDGNSAMLWLQWLSESEKMLKDHGFAECAALAGIRADVLVQLSEKQVRKEKLIAVLKTVNAAQAVLLEKYNTLSEKVENVRTFLRQVLMQINDAGMLEYDDNTDFTSFVNFLFQQMNSNAQLSGSIHNAVATLGKNDVLRLIAETLTQIKSEI